MRSCRFRSAILIISVFVLPGQAAADSWTYIGSNQMLNSYYNPESIKQLSGGTVEVLIKQSYADKEAAIAFYKKYGMYDENVIYEDYKTALTVIDCISRVIGVKTATSYKQDGSVIAHIKYEEINFVPIPSGSLHEILYNTVCTQ